MSEELMWEGSTLVLNDLEDILNKHLGGFEWEWRSVVGKDSDGDPIWSLSLYVEIEGKHENTQQGGKQNEL